MMKNYCWSHLVGVCLVVAACHVTTEAAAKTKSYQIPKNLPLCNRKDDVCLLKAVQTALPIFRNGLPELGVFAIDPLRVTELGIDQGTGPVSIKLTFKNQDIIGISTATINYVKGGFEDKSYRLEIHMDVPTVVLQGDYEIAGRVLVLPIQGVGKDKLTLKNMKNKVVITGSVKTKDGVDYVQVDDFDYRFTTSHLQMEFGNLFNGDKALGDNMQVFLNENWEDILKEIKPSIETAMGEILKEISNRVYSKLPYNGLHLVQ